MKLATIKGARKAVTVPDKAYNPKNCADMPGGEIRATVDSVLLRQALVNLLDNAVDAIDGNGIITVTAKTMADDVVIEVEDNGEGLPTEDAATLLEPFFSTKGRGSGMGLALVHRIVSDHDGSLELENIKPTGTRVRIVLPGARTTQPH